MSLIFSSIAGKSEFYRNPLSAEAFNAYTVIESKESVSFATGDMTFTNWLFDGYRFGHSFLQHAAPISYEVENNLDAIKLYFSRKGIMDVGYKQWKERTTVQNGQFNMLYSSELDTRMTHNKEVSELFSLQFTPSSFYELTDTMGSSRHMDFFKKQISLGQPVLFSGKWLDITRQIDRCIDDIIDCPFAADLKKLFLRSKAIELFVLFAHAARNAATPKPIFIKRKADKEKLYFVRDYLIENAANPISLAALTALSTLNEYKLKKGFKELFQTSVIDFLIHCRLEQAKALLRDKEMNVSEIAYASGYSSPQYFAKAFKKKYGISPGEVK